MPKRIQRRRTKGWRMPDGAVYVGRGTKWGNRFTIAECRDYGCDNPREAAVGLYRFDVENGMRPSREEIRRELRGHDLACWCPLDQPCHADVLLELANRDAP